MRHVPRPLTRTTTLTRRPIAIPPSHISPPLTFISTIHIQSSPTSQHQHLPRRPKMAATSSKDDKPIKILMLHGYTQNGPLFHAKTRAVEKHLHKAFPASSLVYPTGPVRIHAADLAHHISNFDSHSSSNSSISHEGAVGEVQALSEPDAFGWWIRRGKQEPYVYDRMDEGLAKIGQVLKEEGPFDGVIGFSQGAAMAGMLASLLETGRYQVFKEAEENKGGMAYPPEFLESDSQENDKGGGKETKVLHPPLKFAVSYSGFGATPNDLYLPFYNPPITTPLLHFLGTLDTVVEEARSLRLLNSCDEKLPHSNESLFKSKEEYKEKRVVYHPGGHFLPGGKQYLAVLEGFIREIMGRYSSDSNGVDGKKGKEAEERVEDMDVPF